MLRHVQRRCAGTGTDNFCQNGSDDPSVIFSLIALFVGIINPKNGILTYVNCGNERPFVGRAGKDVTILQATGPVVGIFPWAKYAIQETCIDDGDLLLVFTDGIPDARNEANQEYGKEPVMKKMSNRSDSAAILLEEMVADLQGFIGSAEQFDDITLLAIRRGE